ncbi:hypothetical protein PVL30_001246 [Lodderomyces elongisporus]|uniref:uncharacterized protein n=1 Tax=Lodderomyces elongisporus TaxID=36914 RepID=UPI00291E6448|nr:uncharacterized protein PVL30_001246 [Lodderomyces elongisporus]WLF77528.1 hypothetical protein PVL30_001246 [Lodderomyces elongisporus]
MLGRLFKHNETYSNGNTASAPSSPKPINPVAPPPFASQSSSSSSSSSSFPFPFPFPSTFSTPSPPSSSPSATPLPPCSYEDSYSREILYGTHNANSLKPYYFNNQHFRIFLAQDGGNLRTKQILFDTAQQLQPIAHQNQQHQQHSQHSQHSQQHHQQQQHQQQQFSNTLASETHLNKRPVVLPRTPSKGSPHHSYQQHNPHHHHHSQQNLPHRIHHNVADLNDLCFGCGLPSNESHTITKFHILPSPSSNSSSPYNSVLITRLFSISDHDPMSNESLLHNQDEWSPKSSTFVKDQNIKLNDYKISSRFAIGIVIPIESSHLIHEDIINNWNELSHFLTNLQKLIYRKLLQQLNLGFDNSHHSCEYLVKKRLQFPSFILQTDHDLHQSLNKLIKLTHYSSNTPRLMNTNYLMNANKQEYNSTLINWVLEVLNWLEFKDGRCNNLPMNANMYSTSLASTAMGTSSSLSTTSAQQTAQSQLQGHGQGHGQGQGQTPSFLATVLSLMIQYRNSLGVRPYFNKESNQREVTRIVVMTGNPAVAKRLIFIINGLIGNFENDGVDVYDDQDDSHYNHQDAEQQQQQQLQSQPQSPPSQPPQKAQQQQQQQQQHHHHHHHQNELYTNQSWESDINSNVEGNGDGTVSKNVGYNKNTATSGTPPRSSAVSQPIQIGSRTPHSNSQLPIGIPIKTPTTSRASSSLSKSASTAQLSTSLSSSYSSLQSNFSLSKHASGNNYGFSGGSGSFMEKWKNSFGNGGSGNGSGSGNLNQFSSGMSGYFDEPQNLSSKKSMQSLRAPSPAFEYDEHSWQHPHQHQHQHQHQSSFGSGISHSSTPPSSMTSNLNKLSRTQSLYDLYNLNLNSMSEEQLSDSSASSSSSITVNGGVGGGNNNNNNNNNNTNSGNSNGSSSNLGGGNNSSGNANVNNGALEVKRTKTSVYVPLVSDDLVKNVYESNRDAISRKCQSVMRQPVQYTRLNENTLSVDGCGTGGGNNGNDKSVIFKHKILLPSVGFSDEFRSEFTIQSCPINPRLETSIMHSMKNDLIYYSNNHKYKSTKIRTIFINLRAREVKNIELYFCNEAEHSKFKKGNAEQRSEREAKENQKERNGACTYKTKVTRVFSPLKCLGDRSLIGKVEGTLKEIDLLFKSQQEKMTRQREEEQRRKLDGGISINENDKDAKEKRAGDRKEFHGHLYKLIMELI